MPLLERRSPLEGQHVVVAFALAFLSSIPEGNLLFV
jgi:hypothetical protein